MSKVADARAEALLDEAEGSRRACMPASRADREKMRRLRAMGTVISPARGMYARLGTWQGLDWRDQALWLMRALSLKHPSWVFCEASAAIVHGLSVSVREGKRLHVATPPRRPAQSTSLVCRHRVPARHNNQRIDGVTVTSLERTAFDCLRRMRLPEGLALADSTLRAMGHVSPGSLIDRMCALHAGERGLKGALATLQFADGRAESGGESIARATMLELGFSPPRLQVPLRDPFVPGAVYRADFLWDLPDGSRVVGELDGREKYVNPAMTGGRSSIDILADERLRESRISATGARVMRFSFMDVLDRDFFSRLLASYGIERTRDVRGYRCEALRMTLGAWHLEWGRVRPPYRLR